MNVNIILTYIDIYKITITITGLKTDRIILSNCSGLGAKSHAKNVQKHLETFILKVPKTVL